MLHSPKYAPELTLVPNRLRLQLLWGNAFHGLPEGTVLCAPAIQVLSQWVEDLAVRIGLLDGEFVSDGSDPVHLQLLWQEALAEESTPHSSVARFRIAGQARTADRLLRNWYVDQECAGLDENFYRARRKVLAAVARSRRRTPEDWMEHLIDRLHHGAPVPTRLPTRILIAGFHEVTPLERKLFAALESSGVQVRQDQGTTVATARSIRMPYPGPREELEAAARWALRKRREGLGRIAVVLQGIDRNSRMIQRVFDDVFHAADRLRLRPPNSAEFHLPYGFPLLEQPVVESALLLLKLAQAGPEKKHPFPRLSCCLLSPHWAGAEDERAARGRFEVQLRRDGVFGISFRALHAQARQLDMTRELTRCLEHWQRALQTDWKGPDPLHACLEAWGWPGPLAREPETRRIVEELARLLERLRRLCPRSAAEAITTLHWMCGERRPVLRGGVLSPIQLLAPDDAVGHRFEAAWVGNLHGGNWPGAPLSNPFLPGPACREIPRASPAGELAYCEKLTDELRRLAPEVVFSWGIQEGEVTYPPSPLLEDFPLADPEIAAKADLWAQVLPESAEVPSYARHPWLVAVEDHHGWALRPSVPERPAQAIPGGSEIFADYAASPLLGYLKHRLGARFDAPPEPFADAAWRGSLLHRTLQHLFQSHELSDGVPGTAGIGEAVDSALREFRALQRLSPIALEAERLRLMRLMEEWLDFERRRPPFTVHAVEHRLEASLVGHPITLKADRIDVTREGHLLVIDYKSRAQPVRGWARDRLGEPQLPLYACLLDDLPLDAATSALAVGGIALAIVRHGECDLLGMAGDPSAVFAGLKLIGHGSSRGPGKRFDDWSAAMAHWRSGINSLAAEIIAGEACNRVFDRNHPDLQSYQLLLRHAEGDAWLLQRSSGV